MILFPRQARCRHRHAMRGYRWSIKSVWHHHNDAPASKIPNNVFRLWYSWCYFLGQQTTDNGQQTRSTSARFFNYQFSTAVSRGLWATSFYYHLFTHFTRIHFKKFNCLSSKLKVQSSKFKVQSSKLKVQSSKFKVQSSNNHLTKIRNKSIVILCRCDFILLGGGSGFTL